MKAKRREKKRVIAPGVTIEKMAAEGKCIGHLEDGRVVFVPYSAPGDVADLLITRSKHSHAEGLIDHLITPSERRREPVCPHFGLCGGCKWQHVPYEMQLEAKEQQVYDQLTRIGKVTIGERRPILGCERELGYRNKLEFTFSSSRWITEEERDRLDGEAVDERRGLGFHIPGRFDKVLDIRDCYLMDDLNNRIRNFIRHYCLTHEGYTFFDLREQVGLMRTMMLRISSTGEVMLVIALTGKEMVYDLYTGTGTIASFVSRQAAHVIGIEYVEEAIRDARINADFNGLTNLDFYAGDMKDILTDDFVTSHGRPDVIIADPPRAGMHPDVLQTILHARPDRIVYVSCNPASQARDLQTLQEEYSVAVTQPVDMFPQTHHVENVVLLVRK